MNIFRSLLEYINTHPSRFSEVLVDGNTVYESINYNDLKALAEAASMQSSIRLNGKAVEVGSITIGCYDASDTLMGSEVTASGEGVVDGGSIYLSKDCEYLKIEYKTGTETVKRIVKVNH